VADGDAGAARQPPPTRSAGGVTVRVNLRDVKLLAGIGGAQVLLSRLTAEVSSGQERDTAVGSALCRMPWTSTPLRPSVWSRRRSRPRSLVCGRTRSALQEQVRPRLHGGACQRRQDDHRLGAPNPSRKNGTSSSRLARSRRRPSRARPSQSLMSSTRATPVSAYGPGACRPAAPDVPGESPGRSRPRTRAGGPSPALS
jgi:hypothetical protein